MRLAKDERLEEALYMWFVQRRGIINKNNSPVKYYSQRNAWMDGHIFTKWFEDEFIFSLTFG